MQRLDVEKYQPSFTERPTDRPTPSSSPTYTVTVRRISPLRVPWFGERETPVETKRAIGWRMYPRRRVNSLEDHGVPIVRHSSGTIRTRQNETKRLTVAAPRKQVVPVQVRLEYPDPFRLGNYRK